MSGGKTQPLLTFFVTGIVLRCHFSINLLFVLLQKFRRFSKVILGKFLLSFKLYCLIQTELVLLIYFKNNMGWLTSLSLARAVFLKHPCLLQPTVLCAPCCFLPLQLFPLNPKGDYCCFSITTWSSHTTQTFFNKTFTMN